MFVLLSNTNVPNFQTFMLYKKIECRIYGTLLLLSIRLLVYKVKYHSKSGRLFYVILKNSYTLKLYLYNITL